MDIIYTIADKFFFVFHIGLILFNLFGWLFKPLRKWNLVTLSLTAFSWLVLGAFYGYGYCFLTDWHWHIREKLGLENPFNSYIQFLISTLFDLTVSEKLVNTVTALLFFLACVMSVFSNFQSYRNLKR